MIFMNCRNRERQKGKDNAKFNLRASIHASEFHSDQNQQFAHRFEVSSGLMTAELGSINDRLSFILDDSRTFILHR